MCQHYTGILHSQQVLQKMFHADINLSCTDIDHMPVEETEMQAMVYLSIQPFL